MSMLLDRHLDGTLPLDEYRRERGRHDAQATGWRVEFEALGRELAEMEADVLNLDVDAWVVFARDVAEGLDEAGEDSAARKRTIEILDVRATVGDSGDSVTLDAQAVLGGAVLSVGSVGTPGPE